MMLIFRSTIRAANPSLSAPNDFPFVEVKIDRSSSLGAQPSPDQHSLCETVVDPAHRFVGARCAPRAWRPSTHLRAVKAMQCYNSPRASGWRSPCGPRCSLSMLAAAPQCPTRAALGVRGKEHRGALIGRRPEHVAIVSRERGLRRGCSLPKAARATNARPAIPRRWTSQSSLRGNGRDGTTTGHIDLTRLGSWSWPPILGWSSTRKRIARSSRWPSTRMHPIRPRACTPHCCSWRRPQLYIPH